MSEGQVQEGNWKFTAPGFTAGVGGKAQTGNYPAWATGGNFNPSLVAGWPMNEGSGLTLNDVSGNGNIATISASGAVTWQTNAGFPGTTPLWSGTGRATASLVAPTAFERTQPFSVGAWIKSSTAAQGYLFSNLAGGTLTGWALLLNPSGQLRFFLSSDFFSGNAIDVAATPKVTDGNLHFLCVTYNGNSLASGLILYIDGIAQSNNITTNALTASMVSTVPVTFGVRGDGPSEYVGVMAFVAIYGAALTSAQISTYFASGPKVN